MKSITIGDVPTFHHNNGTSESNLDYFLIPKDQSSLFTNPKAICTLNNLLNLSAHDVVNSSIRIDKRSSTNHAENQYDHTYTPFIVKQILWNDENIKAYKLSSNGILKEMEETFNDPEFIPLKCELYSKLLVTCAEKTVKVKPTKAKTTQKQKFSFRQNLAWSQFDRAYKLWRSAGKPRDKLNLAYKRFREARAKFQAIRRYEDNLKHIKHNNSLMVSTNDDKNQVYKVLKAARGCQTVGPPTTKLITPTATYIGSDTLEGFAADAEMLGKLEEESVSYDNKFYKLCKLDNLYIFEFNGMDQIKIPEMTISDLNRILNEEMKLGKAADIYKLRVEHLRYAGNEAKQCILNLLNQIIKNIYFLTCPQVKKGVGSAIYKGKGKPLSNPNSFRRITVTPQIGNILDRHIDPVAEAIFLKVQSPDQLGFTKNISYLMGAVERGECQRWAIDTKTTCFGVSFDGKAAFPSVDREILVRELFAVGEAGDYLEYSRNTYKNTSAHMKQSGFISREFREEKGSRQGHKRAAGNFKAYINPCLTSTNDSYLGFNIGPICVTSVCIADDTYVLSDDPRKLQGAINIVNHYGRRYRLVFGADKTKVTVTGSAHDMAYYREIPFWTLYGDFLEVTEENEHLGLIVSGNDEENKNIDKNIKSARNSMFALLGPAFSYKCNLNPAVQVHLWRVFVKPVLTSGLSSLPVRPANMTAMTAFHLKTLRGFLKLSQFSPIAPLYFLLGELPLEATLHLEVLSLFWNIWANPQTKIHDIVNYVLKMSEDSSVTWGVHVRLLTHMYGLPDPLTLLEGPLWPKLKWKELCQCRVRILHERKLRAKAARNFKLEFLNVQTIGLSGRSHPALHFLETSQDVKLARPHLKMLTGDYLCFANLANDRGSDPACRLCPPILGSAPPESISHILTQCRGTNDIRSRIWPEILNTLKSLFPTNKLLTDYKPATATQFVLDCTSLNLPPGYRIDISHPRAADVFRIARQYCYAVSTERTKKLRSLNLLK